MKVFEVFNYNLNQIRFKQNKEFFETLFKETGFEYTDISFIFKFDPSGDACKKTIKMFPELDEYVHYYAEAELYPHSMPDYSLSSVVQNADGTLNCNMKKQHHKVFGDLLKKIPHNVNFAFMGVVLDKINWYKDGCQNAVLINNTNNHIITDHNFYHYLSNSVRFFKEHDYGNKKNYIEVMIERTNDSETLREYPIKFKEFTNRLGKSYDKRLRCGFDEKESKELEIADQTINEWKKQKDYSHHFDTFQKLEGYLMESVTSISNYSPKSVLTKVARGDNYKFIRCVNGCYTYKKINENNHSFVVNFMFRPFSMYVDASISVEGYNFNHCIYSNKEIPAKDKDILSNYAQIAFETANRIENDISELLYNIYGKTPDWFI